MDEEEKLDALRQDFFSYYRRMRSNLFSDTEIVYETRLTTEVFDLKLQQLSQDKKQSEFENFAIAVASRLITPNIKPQTGPDGGGDGKVDGETYPVDKAISDKWWISEGSTGDQKWAIAISVQKSWQSKVEADVKKAVETKRGYTKLLYFTNQKIKSSSRQAKEDELAQQYGISVSIFDGKWFSFAVFEQGCLDIAIEKLNFSDEYRKKTIKIGPNDKERKSELNKIEDDLIKHTVADLDTDYVNDLLKTCILSRGLEKPRMETEGRFNRALREAKVHGTSIQIFNIIYNHAWTSFFWFHDVEATYSDYLKLKDYTKEHPTVHTIERLTNILTNLENVISLGLFDTSKFAIEVQFIKELRQCSKLSQPCQLFLDLYISEHRLFQLINRNEDLTDELQTLTSLIEQCANYLDISFSAQSRIVELLGRVISDNPEFERLVDMIADISSKRESEVQGAMTHFTRANALMEKGNYVSAIKHLGHCVQSFLKEGCEEEYVKSCGNMGMALYHLELPYSAEAYLVKTASFLVRDFYEHGAIPHLLITVLSTLCEIELMLGRLVMYLNWRELLFIISRNGQEFESELFLERDTIADGGWACRFAMADTGNPEFSILPDILDRCDMPLSTNYLKYALGYTDEVDEHFAELITAGNWQDLLLKQPIHEIVAVVTPFKAQEAEIRHQIQKISGNEKYKEMIIGTVHSLQGAQCPIVLFSTVNSPEDHSLFMERDGKYNMLNVAISRAQHHFIVFGNMNIFHPEENTPAGNMAKWLFDAPSNEISNNFIYQQEIPLCTYHPTLRLSTTEEHVQTLRQAFEKARRRLLIVSPFISIHAIENDQLIPLIRHTVQRGVDVTIYTDSSLDYDMKNKHLLSHAKDGRNALIESGVTLIEVKGIHNKSLAIDNHTLIEGSFNWLSANRHKEYSRHECSIIVSSFQADEYINNLIKELESREKTFQSLSKTTIYLDIDQKHPGFFTKESFNDCTEEDICRIKQKVQKLGIQKTVLPPYIRKQRETFPRAYEPWCTEEKEIICELMQKTNHLSIFIECLQRTGQAIQIQIEGKNN